MADQRQFGPHCLHDDCGPGPCSVTGRVEAPCASQDGGCPACGTAEARRQLLDDAIAGGLIVPDEPTAHPTRREAAGPAPVYATVTFPPPGRLAARPECSGCGGAGVTGEHCEVPLPTGVIMLAEVFCATCQGCGTTGPHDTCPAAAHSWLLHDLDESRPGQALTDQCALCGVRGWNPQQGTDGRGLPVMVQVPCLCAYDRLELQP